MQDFIDRLKLIDNGGRRAGVDRRQFSYAFHIPERRQGIDRRKGVDRRKEQRSRLGLLSSLSSLGLLS